MGYTHSPGVLPWCVSTWLIGRIGQGQVFCCSAYTVYFSTHRDGGQSMPRKRGTIHPWQVSVTTEVPSMNFVLLLPASSSSMAYHLVWGREMQPNGRAPDSSLESPGFDTQQGRQLSVLAVYFSIRSTPCYCSSPHTRKRSRHSASR